MFLGAAQRSRVRGAQPIEIAPRFARRNDNETWFPELLDWDTGPVSGESSAATHPLKLAWRYALTGGVPRRSLWAAIIVGTILNLINQGDRLVAGTPLDVAKLVLTYLVPYFVATYGAISFRLQAQRDGRIDQR